MGTDAYACSFRAYGIYNCLSHQQSKLRTVFNAPPPRVCATIARILLELIDQIAIRSVNFDPVKASCYGSLCRFGKVVNESRNLFCAQSFRDRFSYIIGYGACA